MRVCARARARVCAVLKGYLALNWHFSKKSNKRNVSQCFFDKV